MRLTVLQPQLATRQVSTPRRVTGPLIDRAGRRIGYLRLSITKACSMRCIYCRPERITDSPHEPLLQVDEIAALVRHLARAHGLTKVRLTGGDPTSRRDLTAIIECVAAVPGIRDLAMTTNGLTLAHRAREYALAGLKRINVSLDTLNQGRFAELTGVDGLHHVLRGLEAARNAGLWPIRLNSVIVRGRNELDIPDLVRFAATHNYEMRFIELMPMGPLAPHWADRYVPEADMRAVLNPIVRSWVPLEQGHDAARRFRIRLDDDTTAVIGFITPMSCNFCAACNRIRIAADGMLYPCLMDKPTTSLLPALRPSLDPDLLDALLADGLHQKRDEHPHDGHAVMTHIGG
ncbi:MAG: GTP 3',8-cyclase MoaA [Phycisphaeraceae bacterium]|nr:GTP 3',8-cyclase MoaA [Phycisphaeraceae bacterium]